jgi:hypothetical protein
MGDDAWKGHDVQGRAHSVLPEVNSTFLRNAEDLLFGSTHEIYARFAPFI